jgi:ABC-2 type transport system permease protein
MNHNIKHFIVCVIAVAAICTAANVLHLRIDLTADKRYTLSAQTRELLANIDEPVTVRVYLEGDMPLNLRTLQRSIKATCDDLHRLSRGNIEVEYINISNIKSAQQKDDAYHTLFNNGALPYLVQEQNEQGGTTQMQLFPTALVSKGGRTHTINFLPPNTTITEEENINNAIQNLEYEFANALAMLCRKTYPKIAFIEGHDELNARQTAGITDELTEYCRVDRVLLNGQVHSLDRYDIAVIAKPRAAWDEADKLALDQFIMRGGKALWFIDEVQVHEDSLSKGHLTFGFVHNINISDLLFRYGVRINANVVQDLQCARIPINVAPAGMPPKFSPLPWTYNPLLTASPNHPITRSLNAVKSEFPSVIDTLPSDVRKEILLGSSQYALVKAAPYAVSLAQATEDIDTRKYTQSFVPVAVLLSGEFTSGFKNRPWQKYPQEQPFDFMETSHPTQQIVVADGDIIRNDVLANGNAFPLGYDRFTKQLLYGNLDFVRNCILYLAQDANNIMLLRSKVITLRLLDRARVVKERHRWILINVLLPFAALAGGGIAFLYRRKRRYAMV